MSPLSRWLRFPAHLFLGLEDERIYALVRIAFAGVALLNLLLFWPGRVTLLTETGFVDQEIARSEARLAYLSIFALTGAGEMAVTAIMLITALALLLLMAGIWARVAAFWILLWHVSYLATAPLSLGGWDLVLRTFSFLVLISPMGNCWTLPALLRGRSFPPGQVLRYGLILMRLQVLIIYWQAVLARFIRPGSYWKNGEFLSYFMLSHHSRWPGLWVLEQRDLLFLGTFGIQLAEFSVPVLLWVKKTRGWGALLGIALHAGISVVTLDIEIFAISMVMTYTAFLRPEDVDRLAGWLNRWRRASGPAAP